MSQPVKVKLYREVSTCSAEKNVIRAVEPGTKMSPKEWEPVEIVPHAEPAAPPVEQPRKRTGVAHYVNGSTTLVERRSTVWYDANGKAWPDERVTEDAPQPVAQPVETIDWKAKHDEEKRHRVYYQDIVYFVCNRIERVGRHCSGDGEKNRPVVCGTANESSREVQEEIESIFNHYKELRFNQSQDEEDNPAPPVEAKVRRFKSNHCGCIFQYVVGTDIRSVTTRGSGCLADGHCPTLEYVTTHSGYEELPSQPAAGDIAAEAVASEPMEPQRTFERLTKERDGWRKRAEQAERELAECKEQLTAANATIEALRAGIVARDESVAKLPTKPRYNDQAEALWVPLVDLAAVHAAHSNGSGQPILERLAKAEEDNKRLERNVTEQVNDKTRICQEYEQQAKTLKAEIATLRSDLAILSGPSPWKTPLAISYPKCVIDANGEFIIKFHMHDPEHAAHFVAVENARAKYREEGAKLREELGRLRSELADWKRTAADSAREVLYHLSELKWPTPEKGYGSDIFMAVSDMHLMLTKQSAELEKRPANGAAVIAAVTEKPTQTYQSISQFLESMANRGAHASSPGISDWAALIWPPLEAALAGTQGTASATSEPKTE